MASRGNCREQDMGIRSVGVNINSGSWCTRQGKGGCKVNGGGWKNQRNFREQGGIRVIHRDQRDMVEEDVTINQLENITGENNIAKEVVIMDLKRRRVNKNFTQENIEGESVNGLINTDGPKNLQEAGPELQARLNQ